MEVLQIFIILGLFVLSFTAYRYFNAKFYSTPNWKRHNLMFLSFGVVSAIAFTPFAYPFSIWKNLPVFTIIPLCAFNFLYLLNHLIGIRRIPIITRGILDILALLSGSLLGIILINTLKIGIFVPEDIAVTLLIAFLFSVARLLNNYAQLENTSRRNKATLKESKIKEVQIQHQLEVLQAKINPHFLYNSLNSIASLAMVDSRKTRDMTVALSKLLRYSMHYSENNLTTIDEEIEILESYLDVEKIRFGENLAYEINVSGESGEYMVPGFIFQPIVENCVKHAFTNSESVNFIQVEVKIDGKEMEIVISDNGTLFPEKLTPGFGFKNVNDKLQLLFPGKHAFEISNRPTKQVKIVIWELKKRNE
jgi:sensor histidine kinase YesM